MKIKSEDSLFPPSILVEKMVEFPIPEDELEQKKEIINKWIDELSPENYPGPKKKVSSIDFYTTSFIKFSGSMKTILQNGK